jgi:hypothetical protein
MLINELFFVSVLSICALSPDSRADSAALEAFVKQTGIDKQFRRFQREEIPDDMRVYLGQAAFLTKTISDKKITLQWSFP